MRTYIKQKIQVEIKLFTNKLYSSLIKQGGVYLNINHKSDLDLEKLNDKIEELRNILNEVCCTIDTDTDYDTRLAKSQYLDELIVQYMKKLMKNRN